MFPNLTQLILAADTAHGSTAPGAGPIWVWAVPLLALLSSILCGVCAALKVKSKAPAFIVVACLALAFLTTLAGFASWNSGGHATQIVHLYDWISVASGGPAGGSFNAPAGLYMDGLSWLWMLFVTGLATLIALYASEYMSHDIGTGYCRFFAAFGLFVFSMACLVMGDNLVMLYLGWEGVGLCSYLLIGYFYSKPAAVAAAKKAFIVNRIGDLGLAVGIFLTFVVFGTIEYAPLFDLVRAGVDAAGKPLDGTWVEWVIPCLLMIGAFGKSAQFPLYVWLPDAMEGPTPVSALIHAATMVTAGVYLIARTMPLFLLDDAHVALTIVAWIGTITALLAATIGMAQFDIKRIMAYSTVSQLGYMFAGLGVLTSAGAAFHVFTHAFFKALLFLACGAVMHGFAGQLDLRKLSGVTWMPGWRIVGFTMLVGCFNLAGVPLITSGYFSKDMILAQAFTTPGEIIAGSQWIGWILLLTAGLTAYYTFRVYFRVFMGPQHYEPGDELHAHHDHDAHGHDHAHDAGAHHHPGHASHHEFHPHPPGWAINSVLVILAVCTFLAIPTYFIMKEHHGWVGSMVHASTAFVESPGAHHGAGAHAEPLGTFLGFDPHKAMYYVSGIVGIIGIGIAFFLHFAGRTTAATSRADELLPALGPIPRWAQHKWYVDEFYDAIIRIPLWWLSNLFHLFDKLVIDGLVDLSGKAPGFFARAIRPSQSGLLQGYAISMAGGLALVLIIVLIVLGGGG